MLSVRRSGEGRPVVLLHGFTGSGASWDAYRDRWPAGQVIAVDLPGHGGSPPPPVETSFEAVADAVFEVLTDHGIDRADLLGYSMGGRVALQMAVRNPGRIDRLVIESAAPGIESAADRESRRVADEALADSIERDGLEAFVDRWESIPLFASQKRLPVSVRERQRQGRLSNTASGLAAGLRVLSVGRQSPLASDLEKLDRPTLLIVGREDVKYLEIGRRLAGRMSRARLAEVDGAGHTVHLEKPDSFWGLVRDFLEEERPS